MTALAHLLATLLYAAALLVGVFWRGRSSAPVPALLATGVLVHASGFVVLHAEPQPVPLDSFAAALSLIGWLTPVSYLLSLRFASVREVAPWVAGLAAGLTACAAAGLWLHIPPPTSEPLGTWSHAHVLLSTLGFSMLALASLAGLAYLAKERALKSKRATRFGLPSLESLDRMEHLTLSLGFPMLTLGVLTGFVWAVSQGLSPWTLHSSWLVAAWLVYLLPIGVRVVSRQHGERPAKLVVLGFAFLAFSYFGIRLAGLSV
jgi:ABC-type uncharacterized transport system permease subunit